MCSHHIGTTASKSTYMDTNPFTWKTSQPNRRNHGPNLVQLLSNRDTPCSSLDNTRGSHILIHQDTHAML
jgi:hypothetical protein